MAVTFKTLDLLNKIHTVPLRIAPEELLRITFGSLEKHFLYQGVCNLTSKFSKESSIGLLSCGSLTGESSWEKNEATNCP
jgi:hypothetical protein